MITKLVPDTSVIIAGILSERIKKKTIHCKELLVHEAVINELEAQANRKLDKGLAGLEELKTLRTLAKKHKFVITYVGEKPTEFDIKMAAKGGIDSLIRQYAFDHNATLITADRVQATVAESKGIPVQFVTFVKKEQSFSLQKYFTKQTMSVHLTEHAVPKAKQGTPGNWRLVTLAKKKLNKEDLRTISITVLEEASTRSDGFVEVDQKAYYLIHIGQYTIQLTKPPITNNIELTISRPVKQPKLAYYKLPRIVLKAKGVIICGAVGSGKSTLVGALARHYDQHRNIVKIVESPRHNVHDGITRITMNKTNGDVIQLCNPDIVFFDELRDPAEYERFIVTRLSGKRAIAVLPINDPLQALRTMQEHAHNVASLVDTILLVQKGRVTKIFSVSARQELVQKRFT